MLQRSSKSEEDIMADPRMQQFVSILAKGARRALDAEYPDLCRISRDQNKQIGERTSGKRKDSRA
jgi:hypothetical protein